MGVGCSEGGGFVGRVGGWYLPWRREGRGGGGGEVGRVESSLH